MSLDSLGSASPLCLCEKFGRLGHRTIKLHISAFPSTSHVHLVEAKPSPVFPPSVPSVRSHWLPCNRYHLPVAAGCISTSWQPPMQSRGIFNHTARAQCARCTVPPLVFTMMMTSICLYLSHTWHTLTPAAAALCLSLLITHLDWAIVVTRLSLSPTHSAKTHKLRCSRLAGAPISVTCRRASGADTRGRRESGEGSSQPATVLLPQY